MDQPQTVDYNKVIQKLQARVSEALLVIAILETQIEDLTAAAANAVSAGVAAANGANPQEPLDFE